MKPKVVDPDEFDFIQARLGIEAQHFKSSNFGRYVIDRANMMIEDAMKKRMNAPTSDTEANAQAKVDYLVGLGIIQFIEEAISSGGLAEQRLNGEFDDD